MRTSVILAAAAMIAAAVPAGAQQVYPTPEAAAKDLIDSAKDKTPGFGERIFGKEGAELLKSGDPEQDARNVDTFLAAAAAQTEIEDGPDGTKLLSVGKNGWTLPLPLVKSDAGWRFDPVRGKEEVTDRRIGFDELSAIAACHAYLQAQDEYYRLNPEGLGFREYAARIVSSPGKRDGLYWPPDNQADISPLDGLVQDAHLADRTGEKAEPYNGYNFKILKAQGASAPGGAHDYLINGHMIAGHALLAWPAAYGDTGVKTFLCGQDGVVYQKDLGSSTGALGAAMTRYDPDPSWIQAE